MKTIATTNILPAGTLIEWRWNPGDKLPGGNWRVHRRFTRLGRKTTLGNLHTACGARYYVLIAVRDIPIQINPDEWRGVVGAVYS